MKKYSLSLTISYTEDDIKESGLDPINEHTIQEFMEDEFSELVNGSSHYDTEFTVEEVDA